MRTRDISKIDNIYKATLSLVKEKGLAGITMCDISKAAEIGTGTLYIYFKNKEELIKALFLDCRQLSAVKYFEGLDESLPFEKRMQKLFTNVVRFKSENFEVSAFLEQSSHSPYVCMTDLKKKQKALKPLFNLIEEGIRDHQLKEMEVQLIVSFMFGVIHEMVKKAYFSNKKLCAENVEKVYGMFWDGVRREV